MESVLLSTGVEIRLTVIDNGSEPPASVPRDPRVTLVRCPVNLGVAPGRNLGVARGTAPLVCLLDSDARLTPNALRRMADVLEQEPDVALVGPVFVGQPPEASAGRAPTLRMKLARLLNVRTTYAAPRHCESAWDVDFCIGACQVLRRSAWEDLHGLDESYFYGPEDVDYCLRLREAGWRVMQVRADVYHPARRRFRGLMTRRGWQHARAVVRHLWRHRHFRRRANAL